MEQCVPVSGPGAQGRASLASGVTTRAEGEGSFAGGIRSIASGAGKARYHPRHLVIITICMFHFMVIHTE